jgi:hypothetical protein
MRLKRGLKVVDVNETVAAGSGVSALRGRYCPQPTMNPYRD